MKLTFLGTGTSQGVPVIGMNTPVAHSKDKKDKRLRTSALLSWGGVNVNIDCSPDFRQQMLRHKVQHLEAILFTHEHADHTAGLDDIRPFVHKQGDMPIYGLPRVIEQLRIRFAYIFATENRYAGAPSVKVFEVEDTTPFFLFGKEVIPIAVQHGTLPILGYRIGNVAYITDAKIIEKEQLSKLYKVDTLVLNALRKAPHPTHLNIEEALELIKEIRPRQTFLTHISQTMGFHSLVQKELPPHVFLAYDNLVVTIKD
ncbi:MBL fold metallo-hydrolase [uncultured Capnocytophaga sp.]|jgi:octanoyltransferase|uniref:MBL fold metallo-hydrolase n=1 Tax=uncultured Capnocytophaga sp. TaxID=159273 RepID=UPI002633A037|nr:MBL fold metallo-hydrolase [uncultured Capnocytophaga sp.]